MINNFSSKKIQEDLLFLTNKKFTIKYIDKTIKNIFEIIINSKKKKYIISGPQGCGKTTLIKLINNNFKEFYNIDPLCLSLDDYYLTKNQRKKLSNNISPLLSTRGVPGTHDIDKINKTLESFNKNQYPIYVPIFDKLNDDIKKFKKKIISKKNLVFLEGWCCGSAPVPVRLLNKNINKIEIIDKNLSWRNYYNNKLNREYSELFDKFNYLIYFNIKNFNYVFDWKLKQERKLAKFSKININKKNIKNFVYYYEKITRWMIQDVPKRANLIININKNQYINSLKD